MKINIILAGVGGQGILSIAAVMDWAALESGLYIKQAEVHGMSQRGGAVQSHLRISSRFIYSDLIPKSEADMILSVEPLEALRYLPYLSKQGQLVSSTDPFINITDYPDQSRILKELSKVGEPVLLSAAKLASEAGSPKTANMVMLGAAARFTGIEQSLLEKGIEALFGHKGEKIVEMNRKAFLKGMEMSWKKITTSEN